ncbi:MAG: response regulator transcription factor [Bacillota bacterium]
MVKKVLVVDDDAHIREILNDYLSFEKFEVFLAKDAEEASAVLQQENIDIMILDIMLPDEDGWEFCQRIRPEYDIPIIFLSAKDRSVDKITGLELGADDYVTKPFSPREIVARIKAVLRRTTDIDEDQNILEYENLVINYDHHSVTAAGEDIKLTPKEFSLLWKLAKSPKKVFSRERLLKSIWGYDFFGDARTVDSHIKSLRNKLGDAASDYIKTVWGVGYKFDVK